MNCIGQRAILLHILIFFNDSLRSFLYKMCLYATWGQLGCSSKNYKHSMLNNVGFWVVGINLKVTCLLSFAQSKKLFHSNFELTKCLFRTLHIKKT